MSPKFKRLKFEGVTTIRVEVGEAKVQFCVHRGILCNASDFFQAALENGFKESEERIVRLLDDSPSVFESFLNWLYAQRYDGLDVDQLNNRSSSEDEFYRFVDLYVFADKVQTQELKRQMIDRYFTICRLGGETCCVPRQKVLSYCYGCTIPGSALRFILLAARAWVSAVAVEETPEKARAKIRSLRQEYAEYPELLADLLGEVLLMTAGKRPILFLNGKAADVYEPAM